MACNIKMAFWVLLFLFFTFSTGAQEAVSDSKISFSPTHYLLEIKTTEDHFKDDESKAATFDGTVTVHFKIEKKPDFDENFDIVLNADEKTKIKSVTLKGYATDYPTINYEKYFIEKNKLIVKCYKDALKYQILTLIIEYSNPFGKDMTGFYRSSYKDSTGKTRWLLTTHFEPIYARKAFPCFDQPDLKAIFEIHITAPKEFNTVLSNSVLERQDPEGNFVKYVFKKTAMPMSTYLVAFTVSDFKSTSPVLFKSNFPESSDRELRTYGRPDLITKGDGKLAQNAGKEALIGLGNYLKLGYAFEKVDQVGIPDFSAGAMENWGHISFREKSLYVNENTSTITRQSNILTITHELVHQWFGNLVTLETWDYVWLNEAFANYLEYVIASQYKTKELDTSKWNLMNQLVVNEMHLRAFETDGFNSSKPLNNKITDENLIFSSFNDIPYAKGASVLRMWDLELKDNGFQKSLQDYIDKRKKTFANPTHLFESFKKVASMNEDTFKTWTDQAGYPVVEVKKKNGTYKLTQSRFFWDNSTAKNSVWRIPITYSTDASKNFNPLPSKWLYKEELAIEEKCKWIIVNNQQAGYYRVNYDTENWNALSAALSAQNHSSIPELNRAQIINDVYSLARSIQKNYVQYSTALTLSEYLKNETSFITWKTALNAFGFLQDKLFGNPVYKPFKDYLLSLVSPHFKNLNSNELGHLDKLMNIEISRWACALDYDPCVKQAKDMFNNLNYTKFPDTQEIVLCTAVRKDRKAWDLVFNKYKSEENSAVKVMYLTALGCTDNKTKAEEFLNRTLTQNPDIRKQDMMYVLSSVYNGNSKNIEIAFKFIEHNFKQIAEKFGGTNPLGKAMIGIAKKLNTEEQFKRLQKLAEEIAKVPEAKPAEESIPNALKIARSNNDWVKERMDQFKAYFNSSSFVSYSFFLILLCLISVFTS